MAFTAVVALATITTSSTGTLRSWAMAWRDWSNKPGYV
jgi:hypothetical protein